MIFLAARDFTDLSTVRPAALRKHAFRTGEAVVTTFFGDEEQLSFALHCSRGIEKFC
jgi:hypothetical protein